ncbi:MAG: ankyrin repeat domain-containing protein [bacterium]
MKTGQKELITAIKLCDTSMADWAIGMGADVNATDDGDMTPLILSVARDRSEMIPYLASKGADINCIYQGFTPLMIAAQDGKLQCAKMLIDAGANLESQEQNGLTALMAAARDGYIDIVRLLLDAGADWTTKTTAGNDVIYIARYFKHADIIELLEQHSGISAQKYFLSELAGRVVVIDCGDDEKI